MNAIVVVGSMLFLMGWRPAPESLPYISERVNRGEATIGDRIDFTIQLFTKEEQTVLFPEHVGSLGKFVVRDRVMHEKRENGMVITTIAYELISYDVGNDTIPELIFVVLKEGDSTVVRTAAVAIEIKSVAPEMTGQEDIRGLKPQIGMKMPIWQYLLLLGAFGFLIAAILFVVWWRRRRVPEEVPQKPPREMALDALKELSLQETSTPEGIKRFYTELSYILREYYENRFLFPAVEHTTTEIMKRIRQIRELRPFVERSSEFLRKSDLVKFAKFLPETVNSDFEIGLVQEIVEFTTVAEEEESKETANV